MATATESMQATEFRAPSLLDQITAERERVGARYMPTLTVKQFGEREKMLAELKALLVQDIDYGTIPGTPKPTLYQAGAQKICAFFGYAPSYTVDAIEDWDGAKHAGEPLFYYRYVCTLEKDGNPVGQGSGSCNSWESKYRFRWTSEPPANLDGVMTKDGTISEPQFAVTKAETSGTFGKPAEYWQRFKDAISNGEAKKGTRDKKGGGKMDTWEIGGKLYRVHNEGFPDIINTVQKIAQKRAYVAACLSATGASQYFTQDIEDMPMEAIGQSHSPAPGSASQQRQTEPEKLEDSDELKLFIASALKSKEDAQDAYSEICGRIDKASGNDAAANKAWTLATQPVKGKSPSPEQVIRSLYAALLAIEPKAEYLPGDLKFDQPEPATV